MPLTAPKTIIIGARETPEVYAAVRAAAQASGVTPSEWVSRRIRNNLRRTGRLSQEQQPEQTATQEA